jgi:hypothetical protein
MIVFVESLGHDHLIPGPANHPPLLHVLHGPNKHHGHKLHALLLRMHHLIHPILPRLDLRQNDIHDEGRQLLKDVDLLEVERDEVFLVGGAEGFLAEAGDRE